MDQSKAEQVASGIEWARTELEKRLRETLTDQLLASWIDTIKGADEPSKVLQTLILYKTSEVANKLQEEIFASGALSDHDKAEVIRMVEDVKSHKFI